MERIMKPEDVEIGMEIRNGFGIYEVASIEENKYCDGGYGIGTVDGYYFSINERIKVETK